MNNSAYTLFPFLENAPLTESALPPGAEVFVEGQGCGRVGFILHGLIKVYKLSESGREITLYHIGAGESCILSISCALSHPIHQASAVAIEETTVVTLPVNDFRRLIADSATARDYVFGMYSQRLTDVMVLIEEVVFRRMDERLAELLLQKTQIAGAQTLAATHEALALELGTAREVVSRILKHFERDGALRLGRGTIEVCDNSALRRRSAKS